jgi:serine/threonine protein kinase
VVDPSDLGSAGQRLGKGASGFIYETTWLGEKFTRKFFLGTNNPGFEAEASALVDLRHLNIVHTFCWAKDRRSYSLVLEKFGTDLHTYVQKKKETERKILIAQQDFGQQQQSSSTQETSLPGHLAPFGNPTWLLPAVRIMLQIATGMEYLHAKQVVHGDLEPNNILVKAVVDPLEVIHHLHVKVVDFGLTKTRWWRAQYFGQEGKERDAVGFQWKAPEQIRESTTDDPSPQDTDPLEELEPTNEKILQLKFADVYIFASICLYILTGELPVTESESKDGQPPYKLPNDSCCPQLLKELLQKCWKEDPQGRPKFAEICDTLRKIHTEQMPKLKTVGESHLIHVNCHIQTFPVR